MGQIVLDVIFKQNVKDNIKRELYKNKKSRIRTLLKDYIYLDGLKKWIFQFLHFYSIIS